MHTCPQCGQPCTCPNKAYFNGEEFAVLCQHCNPFSYYGGSPTSNAKRSLMDTIPKWLKIADAIFSILIQFTCYVYGFKLLFTGDPFRGAALMAIATIIGLLMHAISKL